MQPDKVARVSINSDNRQISSLRHIAEVPQQKSGTSQDIRAQSIQNFPINEMVVNQKILNQKIKKEANRNPSRERHPASVNVLIVDDTPFNIISLRVLIQHIDCVGQVRSTNNGRDAINFFKDKGGGASEQDEEIDLIFMDINMPEVDGFEATRQINQLRQIGTISHHITIVLNSAFTEINDMEMCQEVGADDYLMKPLQAAQIKQIIQQCNRIKNHLQPTYV